LHLVFVVCVKKKLSVIHARKLKSEPRAHETMQAPKLDFETGEGFQRTRDSCNSTTVKATKQLYELFQFGANLHNGSRRDAMINESPS
jgi:hypothetical protein